MKAKPTALWICALYFGILFYNYMGNPVFVSACGGLVVAGVVWLIARRFRRRPSMARSTAQRLLEIYGRRLRMMEEGPIHGKPEHVAGLRKLLSGLALLRPDTEISMDASMEPPVCWLLFKVTATDELVARIPSSAPAEPGASPNDGPATLPGNSEAGDGPSSVS